MTAKKPSIEAKAIDAAAMSAETAAIAPLNAAMSAASFAGAAQDATDAATPRFDTTPLEGLKVDIKAAPDNLDGMSLAGAKREAAFKLDAAINALKVLAKLSG